MKDSALLYGADSPARPLIGWRSPIGLSPLAARMERSVIRDCLASCTAYPGLR